MSTVHIDASRSYDVVIDECSIDEAGSFVKRVGGCDLAFIVSDSNVAPLYADRVAASLENVGFKTARFVFAAGEESKTLATYGACLEAMCDAGATRSTMVVALGGGVVGDLAGFAAATYMRGCRCVQIPTSLLACIDSSVGGKTAVDLPAGKNLVGAFFQPSGVLVDTATIDTLPAHFFTDGCAEAIKYGIIADARLFDVLATPLVQGDARLGDVIKRCVEIKRDMVNADEYEHGVRKLLNYGHTIGHGIEKESHFAITHGFGVASGMAMTAHACARLGLCSADDASRIAQVIRAYGLPTSCDFGRDVLYRAALSDKKRSGQNISLALVHAIGDARVTEMPLDDFGRFLDFACMTH